MSYGVSCYDCGRVLTPNIAAMQALRGVLEAAEVGVWLDAGASTPPSKVNLTKMSSNDGFRLSASECDAIGKAIWRFMKANEGEFDERTRQFWDYSRQHYLHCAKHGGAEVW